MNLFLESPVSIKEYPIYINRKFVKSIPNIVFIPDIRYTKKNK